MEHTTNYNLNRWESADRIMMEDFNEDNRKTEEALTSLAAQVAQKVGQAEINDALSWVKVGETVLSKTSESIAFTIPSVASYRVLLITFHATGGRTLRAEWKENGSNFFAVDLPEGDSAVVATGIALAVPLSGGIFTWDAAYIQGSTSGERDSSTNYDTVSFSGGSATVTLRDILPGGSTKIFQPGTTLAVYGLRK